MEKSKERLEILSRMEKLESQGIFEKMGISNLVTKYEKSSGDYFSSFEFNVDRNKLENFWYK